GKGTIYRYFRSKEELYLAAIGDGLNGLHAAVTGVLQQDAPLATTVEAVARTMIGYFWQQRDFFTLMHRLESKLKARERADWQQRRNEVVGMIRRGGGRAGARGGVARRQSGPGGGGAFGLVRRVGGVPARGERAE